MAALELGTALDPAAALARLQLAFATGAVPPDLLAQLQPGGPAPAPTPPAASGSPTPAASGPAATTARPASGSVFDPAIADLNAALAAPPPPAAASAAAAPPSLIDQAIADLSVPPPSPAPGGLTPVTDPLILKSLESAATPLQPVTDPMILKQLGGNAGPPPSFGESIVRGILDPLRGVAQAVGKMTPVPLGPVGMGLTPTELAVAHAPSPINAAVSQDEQSYEARRQAAGDTGPDYARLAGDLVSPANWLIPGARGLGIGARALSGAVTGGAAAAMQPVPPDENYLLGKAGQIAAGAGLGAVTGPVGGAIAGRVAPDVATLENAGVNLTAPQAGGIVAKTLGKVASVTPFAKGLVAGAEGDARGSFNNAVINNALAEIGRKLPAGTEPGHDALEAAQNEISNAYQAVLPKLTFTFDTPFQQGLKSANRAAANVLPGPQYQQFQNFIASTLGDRLDPNTLVMSGNLLKSVDSDLGAFARKYQGSPMPADRDLGFFVRQVQQTMRSHLAMQNPAAAPDLQAANRAFAKLATIEQAARSSPAAEGVFTPRQLLAAAKSGAAPHQFEQGRALLQPLAEAAQRVQGSRPISSEVPSWVHYALGLGLLGGGALGEEEFPSLKWLALPGAAALMFTRPGAAVARALGPGRMVRSGIGGLLPTIMGAGAGNMAPSYNLPAPASQLFGPEFGRTQPPPAPNQ